MNALGLLCYAWVFCAAPLRGGLEESDAARWICVFPHPLHMLFGSHRLSFRPSLSFVFFLHPFAPSFVFALDFIRLSFRSVFRFHSSFRSVFRFAASFVSLFLPLQFRLYFSLLRPSPTFSPFDTMPFNTTFFNPTSLTDYQSDTDLQSRRL